MSLSELSFIVLTDNYSSDLKNEHIKKFKEDLKTMVVIIMFLWNMRKKQLAKEEII